MPERGTSPTEVAARPYAALFRFGRWAPALVAAAALVVLLGWVLGIHSLQTLGVAGVSIKANTAFGLLACAAAIRLLTRPVRRTWDRRLGYALAFAAILVGTATLAEYVVGIDLGIDQLAFADTTNVAGLADPGRMAPHTAVGLVLAGLAISFRGRERPAASRAAFWLAVACTPAPLVSIFERASGIGDVLDLPTPTHMALGTSIAFLLLVAGIILSDPTRGPLATMLAPGPAGHVLRRLLPAALLVPFGVGVLRGRGEYEGLYSAGTGIIIMVAAVGGLSAVLVWMATAQVGLVEGERRAVEGRLAESGGRMDALLEQVPVGIFETDSSGRYQRVNAQWEAMTGLRFDEVVDGIGVAAAIHPDDRVRVMAEWTTAMAEAEEFHSVFRWRRADGAVTWGDTRAVAVRDVAGRIHHWIGTTADISTQKNGESELLARARISRAVAGDTDSRDVFALVATEATRTLEASTAAVVRFEGGMGVVVGSAARDGLPVTAAGSTVSLAGATAVAEVFRTGRSAHVEYADTTEIDDLLGVVSPYRAGLAAPVRVGGRLWGAVGFAVAGADASSHAGDGRLERFADLVGMAVATAEARDQLRSMASTDHLTGLPNTRAFHGRLVEEVERARRHGRPLSLVILDVDHFKLVNDTHGHPVGDSVLAEVAARLAGEARLDETLARVGGEEFAWILPDADSYSAYAAAERMRRAISDVPFAQAGTLTVSAGVCDLANAEDATSLFRLADLALYWVKSNGRDATFRYSPEVLELLSRDEQAHRLARARAISGIRILAQAVDAKDPSSHRHSERVADLAVSLAEDLGWPKDRLALLHEAALVHDVGKIGVPDDVLTKPGSLDAAEYALVKAHPALGAQMVADALSPEQADWIRGHHERPDGGGYPMGLAGDDLSDGARVLALADAWDAMTSVRCYRAPLPTAEALTEVQRNTGTQFCPRAAGALARIWEAGARLPAVPPTERLQPPS